MIKAVKSLSKFFCFNKIYLSYFYSSESGVGAGIDSYYEYVLKGYILLGDSTYLKRFNKVRYFLH